MSLVVTAGYWWDPIQAISYDIYTWPLLLVSLSKGTLVSSQHEQFKKTR